MEKKTDGIKRIGTELPFNLQVKNLNVQIGDTHSTSYYNDNSCGGFDCGCHDDCGCHGGFNKDDLPEYRPSWDEYSDFFTVEDDSYLLDMNKMAEKVHKDTGIPLDVVETVLRAESEILDELGIMDIVDMCDDSCEDDADSDEDEDKPTGKEEHEFFEGMTHEEACEATERLLKAIFPELKDKKFTFAVGSVKKEGAYGKKN